MNYITGDTIKALREKKHLTQKQLAQKLSLSDKTISKWETSKGLPDICILEDLARVLGCSVTELLCGEIKQNSNKGANLNRLHFYVCPICANVITSFGEGSFSCCGINLKSQDAEVPDENHQIKTEIIDDELVVSIDHEMKKNHYISFVSVVTTDSLSTVKLYPEGDSIARFLRKRHGKIFFYCNQDGLFAKKF